MPYIKPVDRPKFKDLVKTAVSLIKQPNLSLYIQGEYFGYVVNRAVRKFTGNNDYTNIAFNSATFNNSDQKTLANVADKIAACLNRADPLSAAGELNYAISAIYWGLLGGYTMRGVATGFPEASYGMRAYLTGILEKIYSSLESPNAGSQRDVAMAFRRHLVVRGVLHDVLSEAYGRLTTVYEEAKRSENGDIWHEGKLVGTDAAEE